MILIQIILVILISFLILYIISSLFECDTFDNNKKTIYGRILFDQTHKSIIETGSGASEFLYYITLFKLKKFYNVKILYGHKNIIIDDIEYINFKGNDIIKEINNVPIIVHKHFNHLIDLFNINPTNKYILWSHDHYYSETKETMKKFIKYKIPIVCVSNYHKKHWEKKYPGITVKVIYNALFPEYFIKDDTIKYDENKIIVPSGWYYRNINKVLENCSEYYKINKNFKLILITPNYAPKDAKIDNIKYPFVDNIGNIKDKKEYCRLLQSCLCVMSTSSPETFGCVYAEAFHLGVPVILDNSIDSGSLEIVPKEQTCDFNKSDEFIKKIEEYRTNRPKVSLLDKFYETAIIEDWHKFIEIL
jgi:hypothetical protein